MNWINTNILKAINDWKKYVTALVQIIPIVLICILFLYNRSLFLDSLNLARNVAEGSFTAFLNPLKYEQSAPVLFLILSKIATLIFGISEYSLRLIPVLSGIACIFLFFRITKKLMSETFGCVATFWLGSHTMFVRYATEFKQYSTDIFVTTLLLWFTTSVETLSKKNLIIFAFIGSLCIWLSMPSIFVLLSALIYLMIKLRGQKNYFWLIGIFIFFTLQFIIEYYTILQPAIASTHMQNFHQDYFIQGRFWDTTSLGHDFGLVVSTIRLVVGKSGLAIAIAFLLILVTAIESIKNKKPLAILLFGPIVLVFGASLLGKYSLIERLMLFVLPNLFLLIFMGLQRVIVYAKAKNEIAQYVLIAILGFSLFVGYFQTQGFKYAINPLEIEDNRSSLVYISEQHEKKFPIICSQFAYPAYTYYSQFDKNLNHMELGEAIETKYNESLTEIVDKYIASRGNEVWLLTGHMAENEISNILERLNEMGRVKKSYRSKRSAAILFSTR